MSESGDTVAAVVTDGSLLPAAMAVAAQVGVIRFASPCCLPLVPAPVGCVAGLAGADADGRGGSALAAEAGMVATGAGGGAGTTTAGAPSRRRLLLGASCIGLGVPFVLGALGARPALRLSDAARRHARTVMRVGAAY